MSNPPRDPNLPGDHVAGPSVRPSRPLAAPVLEFDFAEESHRLRKEEPWSLHGRNGVTLVKHPDFRVVFMLMKPGTGMEEHHAGARISVQTVSGHVRLRLKDRMVDLPAGHLLVLERDIPHDVEAIEESAVLLTIAWPGDAT